MKVYLVGGSVRDILLGLEPKDYDFVVTGATLEDFKYWEQVGKDFPVFLEPTHKWEVALARTERKVGKGYTGFETTWEGVTLEEDLSRRDLTVNSMAIEVDCEETRLIGFPVAIGGVVDPFGGMRDLKDKILKPTTKAFKEDPIRLLRVARFLARYGSEWKVDQSGITYGMEMEHSGELDSLVPERVWLETEKALKEKYPCEYFKFLLQFYFPLMEIFSSMKTTVEDNPWHQESDVFVHTMMVLEHASKTWNDPEINFACLLHDIAKPICYAERGNGHGHDKEGVSLVKDFCKKWKVPNNYRDLAKITCEQHQRIHGVLGRDTNKMSRPKSIMKIFEETSALTKPERFKKMLKACESDSKGRIGLSANDEYIQRVYLEECLQAVLDFNPKPLTQKLLTQGKSGIIIGQEIRAARINEIRKVQNVWKNKL